MNWCLKTHFRMRERERTKSDEENISLKSKVTGQDMSKSKRTLALQRMKVRLISALLFQGVGRGTTTAGTSEGRDDMCLPSPDPAPPRRARSPAPRDSECTLHSEQCRRRPFGLISTPLLARTLSNSEGFTRPISF